MFGQAVTPVTMGFLRRVVNTRGGFLLLSPLAIDRYPSPPVRAFITPETNLGKRNEIEKDWEMARAASVPI